MIVFLTGASGYVGRSVLRALRQHGHEVRGLVRSGSSATIVARLGGETVFGDLAQPDSFAGIAAQADIVIHAGFHYAADGSEAGEIDVAATQAIEAACESGPCQHIIYTSSLYSYRSDGVAFDEAHAIPHRNDDWRCDLESRFLAAGRTTIRTAIRLGWVYGGDGGTLINRIAPLLHSGDAAQTEALRVPLVHVSDLASLYVLAIEQHIEGVLHGVAQLSSNGELVQQIGRITGSTPGPPTGFKLPASLRRDIPAVATRSRGFGWSPTARSPRLVIEESLRATGEPSQG